MIFSLLFLSSHFLFLPKNSECVLKGDTEMDNKPSVGSNEVLILVAVCLLLFLSVGIMVNHHQQQKLAKDHIEIITMIMMIIGPLPPWDIVMIWKMMRNYYSFHHYYHTYNSINNVSRRQVPSGPNPIHHKDIPH
ncbi:unnamed protein product [Cuscuta epithymum]|uniref:Transmembrane protein n=1 Tax=Cuscuta epithymum TaxID=186058 RepID=A0AAV0DMH6_9ASTE|nr:unnamed protein product [Cuscuta epithymum]CAH9140704.1 unnamed protein product [Cuscuta epithymum]